jgi:hypothetical protein
MAKLGAKKKKKLIMIKLGVRENLNMRIIIWIILRLSPHSALSFLD